MVNNHSDNERGNPLPPHGLLFSPLSARVILPEDRITQDIRRQDNTYDGLCYTSRGALAGTSNS